MNESDEVAGHAYRQAQGRRLIRYCESLGVSAADVTAGTITIDLSPICGEDGKIRPEGADFEQGASQ